jgi:hypothetical protein
MAAAQLPAASGVLFAALPDSAYATNLRKNPPQETGNLTLEIHTGFMRPTL